MLRPGTGTCQCHHVLLVKASHKAILESRGGDNSRTDILPSVRQGLSVGRLYTKSRGVAQEMVSALPAVAKVHLLGLGVGSGSGSALPWMLPSDWNPLSPPPLQIKVEREMGTVVKFGRKSEACFSFRKCVTPLPGSVPLSLHLSLPSVVAWRLGACRAAVASFPISWLRSVIVSVWQIAFLPRWM